MHTTINLFPQRVDMTFRPDTKVLDIELVDRNRGLPDVRVALFTPDDAEPYLHGLSAALLKAQWEVVCEIDRRRRAKP